MSFRFIPGRMYRMPVVFGPGLGPRQGAEGRKFTSPDSHKTITRSVSLHRMSIFRTLMIFQIFSEF